MTQPQEWFMTSEQILKIANEIQSAKGTQEEKEKLYADKYPLFFEKYSALGKLCCGPNMDMRRLVFMINMLNQIKTQKMDQDKASEIVGTELYNSYVKPALDGAEKNN